MVIQALIGGDLQGGSAATNAVINALLNGAPILGVAGTSNRPYHPIFGLKEWGISRQAAATPGRD